MSEILSYEKFVENLRAYLLDALNLQEERIYFKVKDEAGMTPEGDRLFVECNVSPEGKEVCGIHTEELYEDSRFPPVQNIKLTPSNSLPYNAHINLSRQYRTVVFHLNFQMPPQISDPYYLWLSF